MLLIAGLAGLWTAAAFAQQDEIIVSVRKKNENLQDVPMSVQAFTAEEIERKGIKSVNDIARFSSSIQFDESFAQSDTRIVARGLSPTRGRQNVALLVDGIDVSSESITSSGGSLLLNTRLLDVQRIESVLGPQMALYGRSAFNGAIQYVTKDAAEVFESNLRFDVNDAGQYEAVGSVSVPLAGEALGIRLNGAWWDEKGFYENTITNEKVGGDEGYGFGLTLNSKIGDSLSFKFRTEFTADQGQPSAQVFLPFNNVLPTPENALIDPAGPTGPLGTCENEFINALATVPGNNQAYLERTLLIMDPAFLATLDPSTLDPNSPNFSIPGGGPHCQESVASYTGALPDGDDLSVALAPNPATPGVDYEGFDRQLVRTSFVAKWEGENFGLSSWTGFTRDKNTETQDTNAFAHADPAAGEFLDGGVNSFSFSNYKKTEQFSQDLRFSTSFDGPVNGAIGGLYWAENVDNRSSSITGQASGSHCLWLSSLGITNPVGATDGCTGYTRTPLAPYQNSVVGLRPENPADRNTQHYSIYGDLHFDLTENWTLSFEGRYNSERVEVFGPIFLDPLASGGPGSLNPCGIFFRACEPFEQWRDAGKYFSDAFFPWIEEEDAGGNGLDRYIPDQALVDSIPDLCWQQNAGAVWSSIENGPTAIETTGVTQPFIGQNGEVRQLDTPVFGPGSQPVNVVDGNGRAVTTANNNDLFNPWCVDSLTRRDTWFSPKITMDWAPSEDILVYFSWSRAQKPGGFSLLTVGSNGLNRELTEFDPELMEVWEVGANTAWLDNSLILNAAAFFQDFTDKQALTSVLNAAGDRLISRIVNAGGAEVWGTEVSLNWAPASEFLGGNWATSLNMTWLFISEYSDFVIASTSTTTAANAGNCARNFAAEEPGGETCDVSYTGNQLEDAPEFAANFFTNYTYPLSSGVDAFAETDIIFQDKRYVDITNNAWVEAYFEVNFRFGLKSDRWEALIYVDNLLEDDTVRFSGGGPGLGCCFVLGSGIDISASEDDPATPNVNEERAPIPASTVMVDLPLYNSAFLPDPRVIGARFSVRFGE